MNRSDLCTRRPRIGIDVSSFSRPVTGISRYIIEVVRGFTNYPVELFLYGVKKSESPLWRQLNANAHIRTSLEKRRYLNFCFLQVAIPIWANKDKLDLFFAPAHRLPFWLSNDIKKVLTVHDLVWIRHPETMRRLSWFFERILQPLAIRRAHSILTDAMSTSTDLKHYFRGIDSKINVAPLGISRLSSIGECTDSRRDKFDIPYCLFVGTIEPRKNILRLLQAYELLEGSVRQKCQLVIVGKKGWRMRNLSHSVKDMMLDRDVKLIGYVTDQELDKLYKNASFFVYPSIYEGFGLPLVEAMSYGLPILTSNSSAMPEVVGEAGILVDPLNAESIADGLRLLITDDRTRLDLAKKSIERAALFSWKKTLEMMWSLFQSLLEKETSASTFRK